MFSAGEKVRCEWPDGAAMEGELFPADVERGDLYMSMGGGQRVHFWSAEDNKLVGMFATAEIKKEV